MQNHLPGKAHLAIQQLALAVTLGWPDEERLQPQKVMVDIDIAYPAPPSACVTDELSDTFCYPELICKMKDQVSTRSFRQVEHLGHELYQCLKAQLPTEFQLRVRLTKWPKISDLTGGICFAYGDFE